MAQTFTKKAKNKCKVDGKVIEVTLLTQTCQHSAHVPVVLGQTTNKVCFLTKLRIKYSVLLKKKHCQIYVQDKLRTQRTAVVPSVWQKKEMTKS